MPPRDKGQTISRSAIRKVGKRHIYRLESADILNFCDRVRTVWERSRELSTDVVAAERERAAERNDGCF